MQKKNKVFMAVAAVFFAFSFAAQAEEKPQTGASQSGEYVLTLKDHKFSPAELEIPAGQKVKLVVKNLDATSAEFESHDLGREKVVAANGDITLFVGPLSAGKYSYFDDFHRETTTGVVVVK